MGYWPNSYIQEETSTWNGASPTVSSIYVIAIIMIMMKHFISIVRKHIAKTNTRQTRSIIIQSGASGSKAVFLSPIISSPDILLIGIAACHCGPSSWPPAHRLCVVEQVTGKDLTPQRPAELALPSVASTWWPCVVRQNTEDRWVRALQKGSLATENE